MIIVIMIIIKMRIIIINTLYIYKYKYFINRMFTIVALVRITPIDANNTS